MPCRRAGLCPVSRATKHHNLTAIVTISEVSTVVRTEVPRGHQGYKGTRRLLAQDLFGRLGRRHSYDAKRMAHNLRTGGIRAREIPTRKPGLFPDEDPSALSRYRTAILRPPSTTRSCFFWPVTQPSGEGRRLRLLDLAHHQPQEPLRRVIWHAQWARGLQRSAADLLRSSPA